MLFSITECRHVISKLWLFSILVAAAIFWPILDLQAADAKSRKANIAAFVKNIVKGEHYLGGKRPGLDKIEPRGQFEYDHQKRKYARRLKVFVRRAGGDEDGRQVLYNTRTYGTALKQLTGWTPSLQTEWAMRLGLFGYAKKFHPVMLEFFYLTILREANGSLIAPNITPTRRKKTKKSFVEDLPWQLAPGEYQVELSSEVSLADHPIKDVMAIWEWVDFADKVMKVKLPTLFDITKEVLKYVIARRLTRTDSRYRLVVKARVPKLVGQTMSEAGIELGKWNLRPVPANTDQCHTRQYGRIIRQSPAPGSLLDPRKAVAVKVCARRAAPTPTSPTNPMKGVYYLFKVTNCGNGLFIGTEAAIKAKVKGAIKGCGMDWSTPVTYQPLAGPFSTTAEAGVALCAGITLWYHNAVVPHGPYAIYKGSTYPAFEPSVQSYVLNCKYPIIK